VQRRHNCSPAASSANCFMTLYLLKLHSQPLLSIPVTQKCQILSCGTLVANERCLVCLIVSLLFVLCILLCIVFQLIVLCFFNYSLYVCFLLFYLLFSILCVLCSRVVLRIVSPHVYSCLFSIFVKFYRLMLPGINQSTV